MRAAFLLAPCPVSISARFPRCVRVALRPPRYEEVESTLHQKLQMMFFHMSDSGFDFREREVKVFQAVRRVIKATLMCGRVVLFLVWMRAMLVCARAGVGCREKMQAQAAKAQQALQQKVADLKLALFEKA